MFALVLVLLVFGLALDDGASQSGNCAQPASLVSIANESKTIYRNLFFKFFNYQLSTLNCPYGFCRSFEA